jgi:hypothetical protein
VGLKRAATQRQRRGLIPAWGNAPGKGRARIARAESPFHRCRRAIDQPIAGDANAWGGLSALWHPSGRDLGRWPRLVWAAPLALWQGAETARRWRAKCPNSSPGAEAPGYCRDVPPGQQLTTGHFTFREAPAIPSQMHGCAREQLLFVIFNQRPMHRIVTVAGDTFSASALRVSLPGSPAARRMARHRPGRCPPGDFRA